MLRLFEQSWKGEASLGKAFWLVYVLIGIIIQLIILGIFAFFVPNFLTPEVYVKYQDLLVTIFFPYTLFSAICVWRCAKNSSKLWGILAKIVVALGVIFGVIGILHLLHIM